MKKTLKGYLIGFLSAVILVSGVAYAASTTTLYDVINSGVKIVVDGKKLNPTDANGNKVEPIIYNGTTYLPVRAVGNALGKAVYWDGPEFTVYLGEMNGKLEYPTVELENMTSIAEKPQRTEQLTDNYDNTYSHAVYNCYYSFHAYIDFEYLLNMKYSRFKGVLYVPKGTTGDGSVYLTIIADGKTIYTSPAMDKTSEPVYVDVKVKGYNNVKIKFSDTDSTIPLCLGDAGFYQ